MALESKLFKLSPIRCASIMAGRYAWKWITLFGILLSVSLIIGLFTDILIFIIILLVVCLTAPILLAWLFYHYGLEGESYLNVVNHKIMVEGSDFKVIVEVKNDSEMPEEKEFGFSTSDLGRYTVGKENVVFPFVAPRKGFLYLPVSAFEDEEEFGVFVRMLSNRNEEN